MRNKLLRYYKEKVSVEALVNSRIKLVYRFLNFSFWILIVLVLSLFITFPLSKFGFPLPFVLSWILILLSSISLVIAANMYLRRARAVIRVDLKLPLREKTGQWRTEDFNDYQREMVFNFIKKQNLNEKWKIEKLIASLIKDKESLVVQPLIAPTVFITLMVPIINQLLTYLLVNHPENSRDIFIYAFLFAISLTVIANTYKKQIWIMREDLFKNYYHRRDLLDILEDVLLSIEE